MDCLDVSLALNSLVGASLVVAGANLMTNAGRVVRGYGAYCFALGYFILGLSAAGSSVGNFDLRSRRYLLGVGSAVAVVAGTFMMYYHVQDRVRAVLQGRLTDELRQGILNSIPVIDTVLVYAGFAGLALAISLRGDNSVNLTKLAMAVGAFLVIGYTKKRMLESMVNGENVQKQQLAHILSWGLLVLAISYSC